jgi:hypothetical protein
MIEARYPDGQGISREPGCVRIERLLPGPAERLWAYLVDSEKRRLWLAAGEMEPRVGGGVTHLFRHPELSDEATPEPYRGFDDSHRCMAGSRNGTRRVCWPTHGQATTDRAR